MLIWWPKPDYFNTILENSLNGYLNPIYFQIYRFIAIIINFGFYLINFFFFGKNFIYFYSFYQWTFTILG
jgi:hypothetical protein